MSLDWFEDRFRLPHLTILTTEHWTWSVRPGQPTLGCGVLALRRACPSLGDLAPEEGADLTRVIRTVEERLHSRFANDRVNYVALLMRDPQVHLHVFPRYREARTFGGRTWVDAAWPGLPDQGWATPEVDDLLVPLRDRLGEG